MIDCYGSGYIIDYKSSDHFFYNKIRIYSTGGSPVIELVLDRDTIIELFYNFTDMYLYNKVALATKLPVSDTEYSTNMVVNRDREVYNFTFTRNSLLQHGLTNTVHINIKEVDMARIISAMTKVVFDIRKEP